MRHWEGQKRKEPLPLADPEHLKLVWISAAEWNEWREQTPEVTPLLFGADLRDVNLSKYNLRGARLDGANLSGTSLQHHSKVSPELVK